MCIEPFNIDDTDEEEEALLEQISQRILGKTKDLSPAAAAVLDATKGPLYDDELAASVLRAAAFYCKRDSLLLLSIADELEAD